VRRIRPTGSPRKTAACLEHEGELVVLEIAQAAVDQLRRLAAGAAREVALLDHRDQEPAHGRVAGDARAVDAAADDEEVEGGSRQRLRDRRAARAEGALRHRSAHTTMAPARLATANLRA